MLLSVRLLSTVLLNVLEKGVQGGHFKISNLGADANLSEMLQN